MEVKAIGRKRIPLVKKKVFKYDRLRIFIFIFSFHGMAFIVFYSKAKGMTSGIRFNKFNVVRKTRVNSSINNFVHKTKVIFDPPTFERL